MTMANSLTNRNTQTNSLTKITKIETDTGEIQLSSTVVRNYLVNGGGNVTDQEVKLFIGLCSGQKLNPFIREAYLIKYGTLPAQMVVSKDVYQKRANKNPNYEGKKAGVVLLTTQGELTYREGALLIDGEILLGGWCEVYKKNSKVPERVEVSFDEYVGKKKDGSINSQWATRPATMIRKVAVAQALREAFTEDFQGMYTAEEMGMDENELNKENANIQTVYEGTNGIPEQSSSPMVNMGQSQKESIYNISEEDPMA